MTIKGILHMTLEVIYNQEVLGKDFQIYGTTDNPLFLAKDVAELIDYAFKDRTKGTRNVNMMLQTVDEDEKLVARLFTSGQHREMYFLTEDGLYEVLLQSRKPIAKSFKKEVKAILKQIRLTGGVVVENREEEFIFNYFPSFSDEVKVAMVQDLRVQNQNLKFKIKEQAPKVEYHDNVLNSDKLKTTTEIAKQIGLTAVKLNKILHDKKVQYKDKNNTWVLYADYDWLVDQSYAGYKVSEFANQLKWTEKGREWIVRLLMSDVDWKQTTTLI